MTFESVSDCLCTRVRWSRENARGMLSELRNTVGSPDHVQVQLLKPSRSATRFRAIVAATSVAPSLVQRRSVHMGYPFMRPVSFA